MSSYWYLQLYNPLPHGSFWPPLLVFISLFFQPRCNLHPIKGAACKCTQLVSFDHDVHQIPHPTEKMTCLKEAILVTQAEQNSEGSLASPAFQGKRILWCQRVTWWKAHLFQAIVVTGPPTLVVVVWTIHTGPWGRRQQAFWSVAQTTRCSMAQLGKVLPGSPGSQT